MAFLDEIELPLYCFKMPAQKSIPYLLLNKLSFAFLEHNNNHVQNKI